MTHITSYAKLALISAAIALYAALYVATPHTSFLGERPITIAKGQGSRQIADALKNDGFIRSKWAFVLYVTFVHAAGSLKPGNYVFDASVSIPEITAALSGGRRSERAITVLEGWNVNELAEYLHERGVAQKDEFKRLAAGEIRQEWALRFSFLDGLPRHATLEGFLFPDTYRIFGDASAEDIVIKMLDNFDRKVTSDMREDIRVRRIALYDLVTMASLIEEEFSGSDDSAMLAGILWKRLTEGMPLQVDATINYVTGGRTTRVTIADTKIASPYNTYMNKGLPRGPISSPGLGALRAALYPKESRYYFYLSAPDGTTIFSRTLEEHNIAKEKYLR